MFCHKQEDSYEVVMEIQIYSPVPADAANQKRYGSQWLCLGLMLLKTETVPIQRLKNCLNLVLQYVAAELYMNQWNGEMSVKI